MRSKIEKTEYEMLKVEDKINALKVKYKNLEKQKLELENLEIIGIFRTSNVTIKDMSEAIKMIKTNPAKDKSFFNELKGDKLNEEK